MCRDYVFFLILKTINHQALKYHEYAVDFIYVHSVVFYDFLPKGALVNLMNSTLARVYLRCMVKVRSTMYFQRNLVFCNTKS